MSAPDGPAVAPFLEARRLCRRFGPVVAVDGVDLSLARGAFLSVFGPNGAGKTTLLALLGGGLRPTSGEVRIGGESLQPGDVSWRARIGVLSHRSFLYGHLSAAENLSFYAALYGLAHVPGRVREALGEVGLAGRANDQVRTYSRGMRQRLALARTLLHDPDLILLDEPYTGLDVHAAAVLRRVLVRLRDGRRTVVLVTHNLGEGLELADRVAVLVGGRFVHLGAAEDARRGDFARDYLALVEGAA